MMIPVFAVRDMAEAVAFYTTVLDFQIAFGREGLAPFYVGLTRGGDEFHLNLHFGEGRPTWYLGFTRENVPEVLIAEGRVVVVRPTDTAER